MCDVFIKIMDKGIPPDNTGSYSTVKYDFIWIFRLDRGTPELITLYPLRSKDKSGESVSEDCGVS